MKKTLKVIVFLVFIIFSLGALDYYGIIWHNSIFANKYEVKGIDVSSYQGMINWEEVAKKNKVQFVFIKATEGHDFISEKFAYNWQEAKKQDILTGAYHFFSTRSSGVAQAESFIKVVPKDAESLPPVIDVEIAAHQPPEKVWQELKSMASMLEEYYDKKPILYVTYESYNEYIKAWPNDYELWIRDIWKLPKLEDQDWLLWQYSNRGRILGIEGYVDLNVFKGSLEELKAL